MEKFIQYLHSFDTFLEELFYGDIKSTMPETPFLKFCALIRNYEGANLANNNPYNERYYWAGYLPKYGVVKESSGGFAVFSTPELGEEYGEECIRERILNHPEWDFLDFFNSWAPSKDKNNPVLYAKTIAAEMGSVVTANLKNTLNL